jgi:hypothetical protein
MIKYDDMPKKKGQQKGGGQGPAGEKRFTDFNLLNA